ncbi:glycoside hydrolase family 39 protein [Mycena albidolilacea]|uniref:Glycoside hydrolase family 39 protein n=1 Tax=Mycena albidolilacea TaxID=1033008 RepID=A0AAD6ZVP2_9AGAR|nr:glycoside hydrolase family 39 protein [Mycena albidolilacea]
MIAPLLFLAGIAAAAVVDLESRQTAAQITTVDLAVNWGAPIRRASGILYGVPNTKNQIPSTFYTSIGFNYLSAGGAQFPAATGWIFGGYTSRFQNVLSNFQTARQFNAQFILKMSDLWGTDGTQGSNGVYPGANNDFVEYDAYLTQLVKDLKANGMTTNIKLLIWNEPDLSLFWAAPQAQYFATWSHAVKFLRANLPGVPIAGPAMSQAPSTSNTWWTGFLTRVKADNTAPDVYTWHHEAGSTDINNDLQTSQPAMVNMLNSFGLAIGEFVIDEYGNPSEQTPSGSAWWIARFERFNMSGLRGNWLSGANLQDFMAGLLWKSGSTYFANGEWQVYKYYAGSMTGFRVATTGSTDRLMDNFAVVGTNIVRILVGGRVVTGTYSLQIKNLSALGLPTAGTISVRTRQFSFAGTTGQEGDPTDLGLVAHTYTGNVLSFPIFQTDSATTWAFEFGF